MKIINYILVLLFCLVISCDNGTQTQIIECPRPYEIPEWVEWDCDKDKAWKDGNVYFNEDSTAIAFGIEEAD